jgi:hypothetical protein
MEKVVYLLGAGFSAPFGLPVMSNFLIKSKDMYFTDPDTHKHFKSVFETINEMSVSKNYYEADLFNIEEILSILEMGSQLEGEKKKESFLKYICDVIEYYTPTLVTLPDGLPEAFYKCIFGKKDIWNYYGFFVSTLHNIKIERKGAYGSGIVATRRSKPEVLYSVITLNYDMVLENICTFINANYLDTSPIISFTDEEPDFVEGHSFPVLAKLHGSIDSGEIVPPTWNKGVKRKILESWRLAYHKLIDATHLRIIGYSLPIADAYVKYLLKSAVIKAPHLKSIDVICKDDKEDSVKKRYDEFINFNYYRFINGNVLDYLKRNFDTNLDRLKKSGGELGVPLNCLENVHNEFMKSPRPKSTGVQPVIMI